MLRSMVAYVRSNLLATGIGVAVGAMLVGGATLVSAHGGDTSLIHACVNKYNQAVRVVGADQNCLFTENAVHWNQQGPAGETGPTGATGPAGSSGTVDVATYTVLRTYTCETTSCAGSVEVSCDPGDLVIDGYGANGPASQKHTGGPALNFNGWELPINLSSGEFREVLALCLDLGEPHEE